MEFEIRPANHADIDGIRDVARRTWHAAHEPIIGTDAVEEFLTEHYDAESFRSRIDHDPAIVVVADDPGSTKVGYAFANPTDGDEATFGLAHIYVRPDSWGEGIGRQLLEHVERTVRDRGGERITLGVMAENERAIRFYEDAGYDRTDTFYDERIDTSGYTYVKEFE